MYSERIGNDPDKENTMTTYTKKKRDRKHLMRWLTGNHRIKPDISSSRKRPTK